eukprot:TRINITY_DN9355_c3_g1_i1.p1 TRINITY_DN9355_c3_g1~~TRINITY_DN9355_c3_g1_i1.p1  ORF type:complete len:109 (-),score=1.77 TRINITY_DN9355_c3_g1_i1:41-367(-)
MYFKSQHSVWYVLMCINLNLISSRRKKCIVMKFVLFRMNFPKFFTCSIKTNRVPPLKKFVKKSVPAVRLSEFSGFWMNFSNFSSLFQFELNGCDVTFDFWLLTFEGCN